MASTIKRKCRKISINFIQNKGAIMNDIDIEEKVSSSTEQENAFNNLSEDVFVKILSFLSIKQVTTLTYGTSKMYNGIIKQRYWASLGAKNLTTFKAYFQKLKRQKPNLAERLLYGQLFMPVKEISQYRYAKLIDDYLKLPEYSSYNDRRLQYALEQNWFANKEIQSLNKYQQKALLNYTNGVLAIAAGLLTIGKIKPILHGKLELLLHDDSRIVDALHTKAINIKQAISMTRDYLQAVFYNPYGYIALKEDLFSIDDLDIDNVPPKKLGLLLKSYYGLEALRENKLTLGDLKQIPEEYIPSLFHTPYGAIAYDDGIITLQDILKAKITPEHLYCLLAYENGLNALKTKVITKLEEINDVANSKNVAALFASRYGLDALRKNIIALKDLNAISDPEKIKCFFNSEIALDFLNENLITLKDVDTIKEIIDIQCLVGQKHGEDIFNAFKELKKINAENIKTFLKQSVGLIHLRHGKISMQEVVSKTESNTKSLFNYLKSKFEDSSPSHSTPFNTI
jgi:hypothetical protein